MEFLEKESVQRKKFLKVYFVYGNEKKYSKDKRAVELEKLGTELNIRNVALTFVPSFTDEKTETFLNKINPEVSNTFIVYKYRNIIDKYINLLPTKENFILLSKTLDDTKDEKFELAAPAHE